MPFFKRPAQESHPDFQSDLMDQRRLAEGKLPLGTENRLHALSNNPKFFTSTLSVNGFALLESQGILPLGQVTGSSIYHVGWQRQPFNLSMELTRLSEAQQQAGALALGRLQQEAAALGAHGVVDVRIIRHAPEWGNEMIEWTVMGTAISIPDTVLPKHPFLCALSAQEYWSLRKAGVRPVGFAFGICAYYHVASSMNQYINNSDWIGGGYPANVELTDYTQAFYQSRHIAMERLSSCAAIDGAEGVIGVSVEHTIKTQEVEVQYAGNRLDLLIHFTAMGTSVVQHEVTMPKIDPVVSIFN